VLLGEERTMFITVILVIVSVMFSVIYLVLYKNNRTIKSFLYTGISLFCFSIYFVLQNLNINTINRIIFVISIYAFVFGISRAITVESGYYKYFRKSVPWYKPLLLKKIFLKEDQRISKKTGTLWGIFFIILSFISMLQGKDFPNLLVFLSGIGVLFYSIKYLGKRGNRQKRQKRGREAE
jgi:hypothetical protein